MVFYRLPSNISKRPIKHAEMLGARGVEDAESADSSARRGRCSCLEFGESCQRKSGDGLMSGCAQASQETAPIVAWAGSVAEVGS